MSQHTPEPWKDAGCGIITSNRGVVICEVNEKIPNEQESDSASVQQSEANAARIVACVNSCAGLNPAAYKECVSALVEVIDFCHVNQITTGQRIRLWKQALAHAEQSA